MCSHANQLSIVCAWFVWVMIIHRDRTQQHSIAREDRGRTAGANPKGGGQLKMIGPVRIGRDVRCKNPLTFVSGAATRTHARTDAYAVDEFVVLRWQAGCRSVPEALGILVEDQ